VNDPKMTREEHARRAFEQASLSVVGALGGSTDDQWLHRHLDDGCEICSEAVIRVSVLFDQLLLAAPPVRPSRAVRDRVRDRIRGGKPRMAKAAPSDEDSQVWNRWVAGDAKRMEIHRGGEEDWEVLPDGDIRVRRLYVDEERNEVTMLVRMEPGSSYPAHRHGGDEQCYVLEGELNVGNDEVLRKGDFQVCPAGSHHDVQSTRTGCLLLIVSSRDDEILAG